MQSRVILLAGLILLSLTLAPRVYILVEEATGLFPVDEGVIVLLHLPEGPWFRTPFIVAHACIAWGVVLIRTGHATLLLKVLMFVVLSEMVAIYLTTFRFWNNGFGEVPLY